MKSEAGEVIENSLGYVFIKFFCLRVVEDMCEGWDYISSYVFQVYIRNIIGSRSCAIIFLCLLCLLPRIFTASLKTILYSSDRIIYS